jgi:hypothetical protein
MNKNEKDHLAREILDLLEYAAPHGSDWWSLKDIVTELNGPWKDSQVREVLETLERLKQVERIKEGIRNMWTLLDSEITKVEEPAVDQPEADQPETDQPETDQPETEEEKLPDPMILFIQSMVLLRTGSTPPMDLVAEIVAAYAMAQAVERSA